MRQQLSDNISRILNGTTTAILVVVVLIFHLSCKGESSEKLIAVECSDSLPVMSTFDVNTIISDSKNASVRFIKSISFSQNIHMLKNMDTDNCIYFNEYHIALYNKAFL